MVAPVVLHIAHNVAADLATGEGARAVVLTGSHARGEAQPTSDIDLVVLEDEPQKSRLVAVRGHLVSLGRTTPADALAGFDDPGRVGTEVPGWRTAVPLHDPDGLAADLTRRAEAWEWAALGDQPDRYVADEITGWAEEMHRLAHQHRSGDDLGAAVTSAVIGLRLRFVLAVHLRLLYASENAIGRLVGTALGDPWPALLRAALGVGGDRVAGAARLYRETADIVTPLLDADQRAVVAMARELAVHLERDQG